MALQGCKAMVKVQSSSLSFTDEAVTTSDHISYQITDTSKRIWAHDSTIVVKDNGVVTTESYTLSRLTGTVIFSEVGTGRGPITVTGDYVLLSEIVTANSYSFSGTSEMQDITPFNNGCSREFQPVLKTATVDLVRFFLTDSFFVNSLLNNEIKVIELYPEATGEPLRMFAFPTTDTVESTVEGVIPESISYQVTTEFNFGG